MRVFLLAFLCAVALKGVVAEGENEVKQGTYPFMAFLYYPDETILDNGASFTRSAALISNDWLISSGDVSVSFPEKTILARLGAVNIDKNFTLNEDEDEQEREIILILRPYNHSATQWWKTDISLLKTLLPFNLTSSVALATLVSNPGISDKDCYILVYATRDNGTDRILIQMNVEMLPPTHENCGNYFEKETMACAADSDKDAAASPDFCQGNRGGPLMCGGELTGLQTYINDCKQPHLYQLVTAWKKMITCATEQRYLTQPCADVCVTITKDPPSPSTLDDAAQQTFPEMISDAIELKLYTPVVYSESTNTQISTDASENLSTAEVEKHVVTSEIESTSLETTANEEEIKPTTFVLKDNISHAQNTTEVTPCSEEEALSDSTGERNRKNQIESQIQLVHSEASQIIPSVFYYLMTFLSVGVYLNR